MVQKTFIEEVYDLEWQKWEGELTEELERVARIQAQ